MGKTERDLQQEILHMLNLRRGVWAWKFDPSPTFDARSGTYRKPGRFALVGGSDIQGIDQDGFFAIEVKSETGRLRPEQIAFLTRVRKMGFRAGVARSLDEAVEILDGKNQYEFEFSNKGSSI